MDARQDEDVARDISKLTMNGSSTLRDPEPEAFRTVIRNHHVAQDITHDFTAASHKLKTGQLIKDENFTLFEAVQGLEIMDPKMDSGCLREGETPFDEYDFTKTILPEEILGIMDQLLCYEMAWHQGYPLSQTLLTSLHMEYLLSQKRAREIPPYFHGPISDSPQEPSDLVQLVLRAYCIAVIKACDISMELVATQQYFEDEDFSTNTYNREFLVDIPDESCTSLLDEAIVWVTKNPGIDGKIRTALLQRLGLRLNFLKAFMPEFMQGTNPAEIWQVIKGLIQDVRSSHPLSRPVSDAFSAKTQRKLPTTVPPRPTIELSFEEASQGLEKICQDSIDSVEVLRFDGIDGLKPIYSVLWDFASKKPLSSAFSRALLQSYLFSEGKLCFEGSETINEMIFYEIMRFSPHLDDKSVWEEYWSVEVPTDPRYILAREVDQFTAEASREIINILRALCANPSRIRRLLSNVLEDLSTLYVQMGLPNPGPENEKFQSSLEQNNGIESQRQLFTYCAANFIRHTTLLVAEWFVQLGLEHDIYESYELCSTYRLLYHYAQENLEIHRAVFDRQQQSVSEFKKHLKPSRRELEEVYDKIARFNGTTAKEQEFIAKFTIALSQLYEFLERSKLLGSTNYWYTKPHMQYELRNRPLLRCDLIRSPTFKELTEAARSGQITALQLLTSADNNFTDAKEALNALRATQTSVNRDKSTQNKYQKKIMVLLRCVVTVKISLAELLKRTKDIPEQDLNDQIPTIIESVTIPKPEACIHASWVLPKIKYK